MSSVFYRARLYWYGHTHNGCAKRNGHEIHIDHAPCICGKPCDCDVTPELGVWRIRDKDGGWRDMERSEIVDAERILRDLIPGD